MDSEWLNMMNVFLSGADRDEITSARKTEGAQDEDGEGGNLITGNGSDDLRGGAQKFVEETE